MDRSRYSVRISRAADAVHETEPANDDWQRMTPSERMAMAWQLTLEKWAAAGNSIDPEPRLQKNIVRIIRAQR